MGAMLTINSIFAFDGLDRHTRLSYSIAIERIAIGSYTVTKIVVRLYGVPVCLVTVSTLLLT